ncbi:MAG: hypothetical protein WC956_08550, partial [bacterium]
RALNVSPAFILFAGTSPRDGADIGLPYRRKREGLLLNALRTLKNAEKKRAEQHRAAMRNAINLITKALQPDAVTRLAPLENIVAKKGGIHKSRAKQHR